MSGIKSPLVSILTPVHETDISCLERAYKSVIAQEYGSKDIEWVLVLHNCSSDYKSAVYERFGLCSDVVIIEADIPGTGLAYARQETLKAASGTYVFFLDSDDEMTPHCVPKVIKAMEETGADTAMWSAFVKIGTGGFGCWCDADPSKGRLILERGDPRIGSTLCYSGAGIWTRAYKKEFLLDRKIGFDQECPNHITDPVFNMDTAIATDKTVILPGLVGYTYYYGLGMMTSDPGRASGDILGLLDRYFEKYRAAGLTADNLMWLFLSLLLYLAKEDRKNTEQTGRESIYENTIDKVRGYASKLAAPSMEWHYLQKTEDRLYGDVMRTLMSR